MCSNMYDSVWAFVLWGWSLAACQVSLWVWGPRHGESGSASRPGPEPESSSLLHLELITQHRHFIRHVHTLKKQHRLPGEMRLHRKLQYSMLACCQICTHMPLFISCVMISFYSCRDSCYLESLSCPGAHVKRSLTRVYMIKNRWNLLTSHPDHRNLVSRWHDLKRSVVLSTIMGLGYISGNVILIICTVLYAALRFSDCKDFEEMWMPLLR